MDKQKIILIVDDQQPDLDVLADSLNPDYRIVTATSGEQASATVRADIPPDLILLGSLKPEMER